jgi:hypothetical protein
MNVNNIEESIDKILDFSINNFIFIYTPPKVGSTTLVTSLRVSLGKSCNIIHIHDEVMLSVLTGVKNIKINDIIHYLSNKGKNVYVIDVYRTPIERKMSEFFEKITCYHFNNTAENISNYSMKRICDRFNKIFPHIENGDHYFDKYDILEPIPFNFDKKYSLQIVNNISYIKIRLCDSHLWSSILSNIFNIDIVIIRDYQTENKSIGQLYKKFKDEYTLPSNYFEMIKNNKHLNFYYDEIERKSYLDKWKSKLCEEFIPYTDDEYKFYINLCLENQYMNDIQTNHYIDNNCFCKNCHEKRKNYFFRAKNGEKNFEKIIHNDVFDNIKKVFNKYNYKINNQYKKTPKFSLNLR